MARQVFYEALEGAQHGPKGLDGFLDFVKGAGGAGAQPSNYMLQTPDGGGFRSADEIKESFSARELRIAGVSAHCPFWVHTTAWTESPTIRPFIPGDIAKLSPQGIETWAEEYLLRLMGLCAELGVKIIPMFWGVAFSWEVATGYPWGFWQGDDYDLIKEGEERFVKKTECLRTRANQLGIVLAHEIHPGTAARCSAEFKHLVSICDDDKCIGVNEDPSHNWEGESWEDQLLAIGDRVYGAHVKNHVVWKGLPLRVRESDWQKRPVQFTNLATGDINMERYVECLIHVGYPQRYCRVMGTDKAPLVVEAESAYRDPDATSANGIAYVRDHLCFPLAADSFEKGMGQK